MYIELITCPNCQRKGRPGESGFQYNNTASEIYCDCKNTIKITDARDQEILSSNSFARISAASNYLEQGQLSIDPGCAMSVSFKREIDYICKVYLTPNGKFLYAKEVNLTKNGMLIISAKHEGENYSGEKVNLVWLVHGLIEIDNLPSWYIQFYSAISNLENGLYKAAVFDYAVAFEAFLESHLRSKLKNKYDENVSKYLLKTNWKIEERCKNILELATGKRLTDRVDVYTQWDTNVRMIRNKLFHGEPINIDRAMAENAHSAVYQAIRYIENECQ